MTKEPTHFSAKVPFAGFYCSWHDELIDSAEERLFSGDDGRIISEKLYQMFYSHLDYSSVFESYAKTYVAALGLAIAIPLDYEEMRSPRYYNFETDRLFAKLSRSDLAKVLRAVRGKWLNDKIKECCTSRSGFISFYPNAINRWPRIAEWDHNHVGIVLECYIDKLREQEVIPSENIFAQNEITCDDIQGWLEEAATGDSESQRRAARALKLNWYLHCRAERRSFALAR